MRQLAPIESLYAEHKIAIQTTAHLQGELTVNVLQQALQAVAARHPLLSSQIVQKEGSLYFAKMPPQEIPIKVYKGSKIHEVLRTELNLPIPEKPLFRAAILDHSFLIVTVHHAVADGISCMQLQKEILETYAALVDKRYKPAPPLPLIHPLEYFSSQETTPEKTAQFVKRQTEYVKTLNVQTIPHAEGTPTIEFIQRRLNLEALQKRCKEHQVTIHGALCAAHLLAVREMISNTDQPIELYNSSPVNLRPRINPPMDEEHMLSMAWGHGDRYSVSKYTSLWTLASAINKDIAECIESKEIFDRILAFRELMSAMILISFSITNVGKIRIPKHYGPITLKEIYFIPIYWFPFLGASVGTFDDQLTLSYQYLTPHFSTDLIEKLADIAMQKLEAP
jgi:NRPS condensation-like uncharacterized protein